jgi:putative membrane protein
MRTIQPIALSVAMALAACGHDEPAKTAYQAAPPDMPAPGQTTTTTTAPGQTSTTTVTGTPPAGSIEPTSADVPREGPNAGNSAAPANGAAEAQAMTDDQILEIVHVANTAEIDQAKLALSKTKDARVRALAQMMVRDHRQSDTKGAVVAKKDQLMRAPSPASESLTNDADGASQTLKAEAAGAGFDKDYVDTQVREHQSLLDSLDQKLIANAKSADLKAYLVEVRAAVAAHLEHAQDLQKQLQQ